MSRPADLDTFDEWWDGALHMVPAPSSRHQMFGTELAAALLPLAKSKGLAAAYELGIYRPDVDVADYRVPDMLIANPEHVSARGVEGRAELAVEIRSPNDETYDKLDFYATVGVQELLVIDLVVPSVELFVNCGGRFEADRADADGVLRLSSLDASVRLIAPCG